MSAILQVYFELNMVKFHELDYSPKFHLRKNNLRAKLFRYNIFPLQRLWRKDYLPTGFFTILIPSIYSFIGNNKFFSHKDFAFYLCKAWKRKKKMHVCPRLPWQWSASHFIQKSMKIRITGILVLFSIMYQIPVI